MFVAFAVSSWLCICGGQFFICFIAVGLNFKFGAFYIESKCMKVYKRVYFSYRVYCRKMCCASVVCYIVKGGTSS